MNFLCSILLQLICIYARLIYASTFHISSDLPPEGTNYVSASETRSTLSILWSSLFTMFICTYTVQHLSVPPQDKGLLASFWRKLKWMLVTLFMPEFLVGKAYAEFRAATCSVTCSDMKKHCSDTVNPAAQYIVTASLHYLGWQRDSDVSVSHAPRKDKRWTKTHAFYANMGGFVLKEGLPPQTLPNLSTPIEISSIHVDWKSIYPAYRNEVDSVRLPVVVSSAQICALLSTGLIPMLPGISEEEINDKSKGDLIIKGIAFVQVLWVVIQLIARAARSLPSAQIEIAALSFATCTLITYFLWWRKPQDVKTPTYIYTSRSLKEEDKEILTMMDKFGKGYFSNIFGTIIFDEPDSFGALEAATPRVIVPMDAYTTEAPAVFDNLSSTGWSIMCEDVGYVLGAVVFGGSHCIAWNFEFPTSIESTLWKVASVTTAAIVPIYFLLSLLLSVWRHGRRDTFHKILYFSVTYISAAIYVAGRLFILAEILRSLFYLPPKAFEGTWSISIPHVT